MQDLKFSRKIWKVQSSRHIVVQYCSCVPTKKRNVLPALYATQKTEAADSSGALASVYPTKSLHISEDYNLKMLVYLLSTMHKPN